MMDKIGFKNGTYDYNRNYLKRVKYKGEWLFHPPHHI